MRVRAWNNPYSRSQAPDDEVWEWAYLKTLKIADTYTWKELETMEPRSSELEPFVKRQRMNTEVEESSDSKYCQLQSRNLNSE